MSGEERRSKILSRLEGANQPISASVFAKVFSVSRQVIVGDVALIRATGVMVRATSRGYVLDQSSVGGVSKKLVCQHSFQETEQELQVIVSLGGTILDVAVDHPIYGELTGNLDIKTEQDVRRFIQLITQGEVRLLSDLTDGIHIHTIKATNQAELTLIEEALNSAGFLYKN